MVTKFIKLLSFILFFSMQAACASDGNAINPPNLSGCYDFPLRRLWKGTDSGGQELVVVYSIQGLWADLKERIPANLLNVMADSSREALSSNKVELTARDIGGVSDAFYELLRHKLSELAHVNKDMCYIDTEDVIAAFREKYRFYLRNAIMDDWYMQMNVNELNVKNEQFISLLAKGSEKVGRCEIVWSDNKNRIKVCK